MKRLLLFCLVMPLISASLTAQKMQVAMGGGYAFNHKGFVLMESTCDYGKVNAGVQMRLGDESAFNLLARVPFQVIPNWSVYAGMMAGAASYQVYGGRCCGNDAYSFNIGLLAGVSYRIDKRWSVFGELNWGVLTRISEERKWLSAGLCYDLN